MFCGQTRSSVALSGSYSCWRSVMSLKRIIYFLSWWGSSSLHHPICSSHSHPLIESGPGFFCLLVKKLFQSCWWRIHMFYCISWSWSVVSWCGRSDNRDSSRLIQALPSLWVLFSVCLCLLCLKCILLFPSVVTVLLARLDASVKHIAISVNVYGILTSRKVVFLSKIAKG